MFSPIFALHAPEENGSSHRAWFYNVGAEQKHPTCPPLGVGPSHKKSLFHTANCECAKEIIQLHHFGNKEIIWGWFWLIEYPRAGAVGHQQGPRDAQGQFVSRIRLPLRHFKLKSDSCLLPLSLEIGMPCFFNGHEMKWMKEPNGIYLRAWRVVSLGLSLLTT